MTTKFVLSISGHVSLALSWTENIASKGSKERCRQPQKIVRRNMAIRPTRFFQFIFSFFF